ncbi:uncharacterized protein LOC133524769 [Cydia pomonella]|uniref:uncharacterized protein LOC133524769 n=1 Tax=Cydia pomonella TaxID=82600 RepID=UPI002ADDF643|nr:uncharacterized protein LOC133524769 [Cydia pomonella]
MDLDQWKRFKKSGSYKRKVKKTYQEMLTGVSTDFLNLSGKDCIANSGEGSGQNNFSSTSDGRGSDYESNNEKSSSDYESDEKEEILSDYNKNFELRYSMKNWALNYNISHAALNSLLQIVNIRLNDVLPRDARTLLGTNRENLQITISAPGHYWHNGLIKCLKRIFENVSCLPNEISLNINIDGLPVFNSSRYQFWPILCTVFEIPNLAPFVVGIYAGDGKPSDLDSFLKPFVTEMKQLEEGLILNAAHDSNEEKIIHVKLRAFICDSPARAMIKGVSNFNSKHGCLKCTVVGEYSHKSNTVTFIECHSSKRNNGDFRAKKYGQHHKKDSPLLSLNIDMIEDFPVSDSLHLIDLGLMKRLLIGWRDGNFGKYLTKWNAQNIEKVNSFLKSCIMPKEIHRSVRTVDVLAHWKGSEYRCFFYYLSFIILQEVQRAEPYNHFMHLFCAITICSNDSYFHLLRIAEEMLKHFVEQFKTIYGKDYITSNIHNLLHLVDEVKKFGILQNFNAYCFENKLYSIKKNGKARK